MKDHARISGVADGLAGWFVRTAGLIGDLGSPFYDEEHQRDVWNEASAVGFQLLLWLLPLAAVISVWVGGATAIPYALVMFLASGLTSWVVIAFAQARGVDMGAAEGITLLRWRLLAYLVLLGAFCAGVVRATPESSFGRGASCGTLLAAPHRSLRDSLPQRNANLSGMGALSTGNHHAHRYPPHLVTSTAQSTQRSTG